MRIYLSPPDVGELERRLLLEAFDSNWIAPLGPQVDAFEQEFAAATGSAGAAALSSGTAALHLAMLIAGVRPGDEVYCPTLTFAATANAICYLGAKPVLIDCDEDTWTVSPALIADTLARDAAAGRRPAAVLTVDLYGQCADYDPILEVCGRYDVPVIADAAEALGARYRGRASGSFGLMGAFSFNGNKIITTSGGGMLVSDRPELLARARHLASQAREATEDNHYSHREVGYNYRMSNLLAALGRGQLRNLGAKVERRREIFARYEAELGGLAGVKFMPEASYGRCNRWLTCMLIDPERSDADRFRIQQALAARDIEARPVWRPMHSQAVFRACRAVGGDVADGLFARGLCLPSGSNLTDEQQGLVIQTVQDAFAGRR
jgi:pyridoxal phosphate-dependent aminotransferase EpsN